MNEDTVRVRTLHGDDEYRAFAELAVNTFYPEPSEEAIDGFVDRATTSPDVLAGELRGIVDEHGQVLGGYVLMVRRLCIGSARLPTGCIGAVAVQPARRGEGLGVQLMQDAVTFAEEHGLALLLLTGIPDWYGRFGYTPVLLETELTVQREKVRKLPAPEGIHIREATPEDAPRLLALYRQHLHPAIGSFDRGSDQQHSIMQRQVLSGPLGYLLAEDGTGTATGYLMYVQRPGLFGDREVAAGDWPTVLALLKEHERRIPAPDEGNEPTEVQWQVPRRSRLYYAMVDNIPCRESALNHPNADWMARIGDLDVFLQAMVPHWNALLDRSPSVWNDELRLVLEDRTVGLRIRQNTIQIVDAATVPETAVTVRLNRADLAQLAFSFRPASWIAQRPGRLVPQELRPLLDTIFPFHTAGISGSDYF